MVGSQKGNLVRRQRPEQRMEDGAPRVSQVLTGLSSVGRRRVGWGFNVAGSLLCCSPTVPRAHSLALPSGFIFKPSLTAWSSELRAEMCEVHRTLPGCLSNSHFHRRLSNNIKESLLMAVYIHTGLHI